MTNAAADPRQNPDDPANATAAASGETAAGATTPGADVPEPASATHAAEDEAWEPPADRTGDDDRIAELEARVRQLEADLQATRDRMLRARADYENLARRTENERAEQARLAASRVIERLLEPLEVLERAAADAEGVHDPHAEGLRMVHRGLRGVLEREGLEEVRPVGGAFDPKRHEAISREPSDQPEGTILAVVRPGYLVHGRLLRAALVRVSAGSA